MANFSLELLFNDNFLVESVGTLRGLTIENCTDTTACNIITKRVYNVGVTFVPSKSYSTVKLPGTKKSFVPTFLTSPL